MTRRQELNRPACLRFLGLSAATIIFSMLALVACSGTDSRPSEDRDATTTTMPEIPWDEAQIISQSTVKVCGEEGDCWDEAMWIIRIPWRNTFVDCSLVQYPGTGWDCDYDHPLSVTDVSTTTSTTEPR